MYESIIRRQRQNITIIQKGRPFQNPANPVLILQAKPITKILTKTIPTKIVNGLVYSEDYGGFLYHAWPEVFVGEWRALDPTFGQDLVDATHIKLTENEREDPFKLMRFVGQISLRLID